MSGSEVSPYHWKNDAKCREYDFTDPDIFFLEESDQEVQPPKEAEDFCSSCPVKRDCLLAAIKADEKYGIWGGFTRKQRVRLQRPRNRKRCPICKGDLIANQSYPQTQVCYACGMSWRRMSNSV